MKRLLSSSYSSFIRAPLSQANVRGAEQACTAIAVLACAHHLFPRSIIALTTEEQRMELYIRQGGALYTNWGHNRYAMANEMVDLVTAALPICLGDEHGGQLWIDTAEDDENKSLSQTIHLLDHGACAVLTAGVVSVALFFAPPGGGGTCELFDSHTAEEGCAARYSFDSRDNLIEYLHERFPEENGRYSLAVIRPRMHHAPKTFPSQQLAFDHADRLPFGFFYVFAHDKQASGSKEYLVAGLDDFFEYYKKLSPHLRCHYDMAREGCPVTFYADFEFETFPENSECNGREMLSEMHALVEPDVTGPFVVTDSCTRKYVKGKLAKVSYHSYNQTLWFIDPPHHGTYMRDLERRGGRLRVWRLKNGNMVEEFFADQGVYTINRCVRICYSSKKSQERYFVPLDTDPSKFREVDERTFFGCILSPPAPQLYILLEQQQQQEPICESSPAPRSSSSSSSRVHPLSLASVPMRALAAAVEAHYKPQQMRGFELHAIGTVMFPMIKHDCEICGRTHSSNNVYVVADLKRRVFYLKCHAQERNKKGVEVAFPASLGPLHMAIVGEMQEGGMFPAGSLTAKMILTVAQAVFAVGARSLPPLPAPDSLPVFFDKAKQQYEVALSDNCKCSVDSGQLVLYVMHDQMVIRCRSKDCKADGRRWIRSSLEAASPWNLSFLFFEQQQEVFSAEAFLAEPNFYRAIGLGGGGGGGTAYAAKLQSIDDWAALKLKSDPEDEQAQAVSEKARIIRSIFCKRKMQACYRECIGMASEFAYPVKLLPSNPTILAMAFIMYRTQRDGYKRCENMFYVPFTDVEGRNYYQSISVDDLLTRMFSYERAPNLFSEVIAKGKALEKLIVDSNHFPSLPMSKRYLAYANAVYDLEQNVALTWEQVKADASIMPFNFIDQQFPVEALERAKATCPKVSVVENQVEFDHDEFEPATPLFDGPLHDQQFTPEVIFWLYALLGRLFHYTGKKGGDNWELALFLIGAPSTFKSSILMLIMSYFSPKQLGVIGSEVEKQFPLTSLLGKLVAIMSECGECTLMRDLFKQMASGDPVCATGKHKDAVNVSEWIVPMLLGGNSFMRLLDTDGSVERRSAVFPFRFVLRDGQGATDLGARIFREEGALLLIKWNTMYLQLRNSIRARIHPLLPVQIREATRQCIMVHDSLKIFLAHEYVATQSPRDCISWADLKRSYVQWCKREGRTVEKSVRSPVELSSMFNRMGMPMREQMVVCIRPRTDEDPPFHNAFEVRNIGD